MHDTPEPLRCTTPQFRDEQPGDAALVRAVHAAALPTCAEADLVDALRGRNPVLAGLVATLHGAPVGHVLFTHVEVVGAEDLRVVALGPMP